MSNIFSKIRPGRANLGFSEINENKILIYFISQNRVWSYNIHFIICISLLKICISYAFQLSFFILSLFSTAHQY